MDKSMDMLKVTNVDRLKEDLSKECEYMMRVKEDIKNSLSCLDIYDKDVDLSILDRKINKLLMEIESISYNYDTKSTNASFDEALSWIKRGGLAMLKGWELGEKFLYYRKGAPEGMDFIDKDNGFSPSLKNYYKRKFYGEAKKNIVLSNKDSVIFHGYICLKDLNDEIIQGWHPSYLEMESKEWVLFTIF